MPFDVLIITQPEQPPYSCRVPNVSKHNLNQQSMGFHLPGTLLGDTEPMVGDAAWWAAKRLGVPQFPFCWEVLGVSPRLLRWVAAQGLSCHHQLLGASKQWRKSRPIFFLTCCSYSSPCEWDFNPSSQSLPTGFFWWCVAMKLAW